MKRAPKKQKTASAHPDLPFAKSKQTGTEILTAEEFRKKYATREQGAGGLQEQINRVLKEKQLRYIRIPDIILSHFYTCMGINEEYKRGPLKAVSGIPDNTVLIPIPNSKFNLALCLEAKSRTGSLRRTQKAFAQDVNVEVVRSIEEVESLIIELIEMIEKYKEKCKEM